MLVLTGAPALSDFRLARLESSLRRRVTGVTGLASRYLHFVDLERPLTPEETGVLDSLLRYGPAAAPVPATGTLLLALPRIGTVSPWSSKATDIAHVCGLDAVRRIERGVAYYLRVTRALSDAERLAAGALLHDRMTETLVTEAAAAAALFEHAAPRPLERIPLAEHGRAALDEANASLGLALSPDEIAYLAEVFEHMQRDPTDVELMMFAQANSEHCRHKIFNADWVVDGQAGAESLFGMIRNTHRKSPGGVLSAYRDNAAVIEGAPGRRWFAAPGGGAYGGRDEPIDILMKVETHNHPTAISPFPGAATGSGGEIRDEGATGRGAKPKAGLTGFSVSNLRIPGFEHPWEQDLGRPERIVSALDIMLEAPIGAASFNNEFGRPAIAGYFRSFEQHVTQPERSPLRGYHKPIMIAGGLGNIRRGHVEKAPIAAGARIVVLGGPALKIGLGGGAASSLGAGASSTELDFASVQRGNPEMQRRAQEVIDGCWGMGEDNPILLIHDVGAGGLSNAVPESVAQGGAGGRVELRKIPSDEPGMSPLELWCNEAQERYVLVIAAAQLPAFGALCERERCPFAVIGEVTGEGRLRVDDALFDEPAVDMPLDAILGRPPRMRREVTRLPHARDGFDGRGIDVADAAQRLLRMPAIADKTFLVTIGDRTVGGMVSRDQMVGPWQVPVSDVAVTVNDYFGTRGEAMAMGERTPLALLDPAASGRMAVAEAVTNIAAADVRRIEDIRLSANWMAACGEPGEDADLYDTVRAVGETFCPALGLAIPVGKDSLSMRTVWRDDRGEERRLLAPVSLIVSAFAPVGDVRRTLTPQLRLDRGETQLLLVDLGSGRNRLGGSCLAQAYGMSGGAAADCDDPARLRAFFAAIRAAADADLLLAYHDRSDGGVFVTLVEMAFAGRCGIEATLPGAAGEPAAAALFAEEPGAVLQVEAGAVGRVQRILAEAGLGNCVNVIGRVLDADRIELRHAGHIVLAATRTELRAAWSETSFALQSLRDNPACAAEERQRATDHADPGLTVRLTYDPAEDAAAPLLNLGARPRVAVLREQGVNSQVEMAAVFHRAGFAPHDVHMTDLIGGRVRLADFVGLIACGGFSYGDVLGAGEGWAKSILFNAGLREQFAAFFERRDTFTLGVCNGCQMLSALKSLVPGAAHWPRFVRNRSEQFEGRFGLVEVLPSPSLFFAGMSGSVLPIATAHGEGRAEFADDAARESCFASGLVSLRYVDNHGHPAQAYPANPNGSPGGLTGLTSIDGRATILMPHPERVFRSVQNSWLPPGFGEDSGWMRLFRNARAWVA
jgi:phosphoribosylformylglycinamidine synthase